MSFCTPIKYSLLRDESREPLKIKTPHKWANFSRGNNARNNYILCRLAGCPADEKRAIKHNLRISVSLPYRDLDTKLIKSAWLSSHVSKS